MIEGQESYMEGAWCIRMNSFSSRYAQMNPPFIEPILNWYKLIQTNNLQIIKLNNYIKAIN